MKKKIFPLAFATFCVSPLFAFANGIITLNTTDPIVPGQDVTMHVSSGVVDLGGADITWSVNGSPVKEDIGLTSFKVNTGALGDSTEVTSVISIGGKIYRNDFTLTPALMDILWEAQTAVPPFFHGKALPSHMSVIRTFAIPLFSTSSGALPSFDWKKDRTISLGNGQGFSSVQVLGAWQKRSVSLTVNAKQDDMSVSSALNLPSSIPQAYFYEISPTQGVLTQTALRGNLTRNEPQLAMIAVPYGIGNGERQNAHVQYDWTAGNTNIQSGYGLSNEIVNFAHAGDAKTSGSINLSFAAQNAVNVMQLAKGDFVWNYNGK